MSQRVYAHFPLGQIVATPGAIEALEASGESPQKFLALHAARNWGEVDAADWQANDRALIDGDRLLSAYTTANNEKLWIVTESDRSVTTLLLPSEY